MGRAWIEVDRAALRHNVEQLRARLPRGAQLMPAVKANAYGHGAVLVGRELNRLGVQAFCVACLSEALELRRGGVTGDILILGYTHPSQFNLLQRYDLTQSVLDAAYARALDSCEKTIKAQIKIDTGMHRLGVRWDEWEALAAIGACRNLRITGAYTHLCAANTTTLPDQTVTLQQARAFGEAVAFLRANGCACPKTHALASYGLLNYPEIGGDYARTGIAMYGMLSLRGDRTRVEVDLRPVLSLKARVAQIKTLQPGQSAGYDLCFTAKRQTKLATLAIGYGDGLPRALSCGVGAVLFHGRRAPIVGRICMDQTLVDVTDIAETASGDVAVLIGQSGRRRITACELAEQADTIANEILSRLGPRLERMYQIRSLSEQVLEENRLHQEEGSDGR